jgi:hypothetical protein
MPRPKLLQGGPEESSSRLPKPKPASAPAVPPRRVGTEAPAANVAAPVESGLTVQFDADDARAAALEANAPPTSGEAAAAAGIPAIVEGPDNDSLPIAVEDEVSFPGAPADITAVGTGPITSVGSSVDAGRSSTKLSLLLVVAGLGALALGGTTAYFALSGSSSDSGKSAESSATAAKSDASGESQDAPPEPPVPAVLDDGADAGADDDVVEITDDSPAAGSGSLKVTGPEGATVFVDDEEVGTLPYDGSLPAGDHVVRVEAEGYDSWESKVSVADGEPASLEAKPDKSSKASKAGKPRSGGRRPSKPAKKPSSPVPEPPPPSSTDAPPDKPKPKPDKKKDDVFMNTSKGDDGGGIFLPVGK